MIAGLPNARVYGGSIAPGVRREGRVRGEGRSWRDDTGVWLPCGFSWFVGPTWAWVNDRDRYVKNGDDMAALGCFDSVRWFWEVDYQPDRVVDAKRPGHQEDCADAIDFNWDRWGWRTQLTVFAGRKFDYIDQTVADVIEVTRGREHKFVCIEVANESWQNFPDTNKAREIAKRIGEATGIPTMVSAVDYNAGEELKNEEALANGVADSLTFHTDRKNDTAEGSWRQVRQVRDMWDARKKARHGEPPGPQSSVEVNDSAIQNVMMRAVGCLSGFGNHIWHSGVGVRFGGIKDTAAPPDGHSRYSNFAEYGDLLQQIGRGFRVVSALLPPGIAGWKKANYYWPEHPLHSDFIWMDADQVQGNDDAHGVVRDFAAYTDGEFVSMPFGIRKYVILTARQPMEITVYDPMTGDVVREARLAGGATIRLEGHPDAEAAYIIKGRFV